MATAKDVTLTGLQPILPVKDLDATIKWYEETLGFEGWTWDGPSPMAYGGVMHGGTGLMFFQQPDKVESYAGLMVHIGLEGDGATVDAFHETVKGNGGTITQAPKDQPWGIRDFNVQDPNGYTLSFGAHTGGQS